MSDSNKYSFRDGDPGAYQKYKWIFDNSTDAVFVMKDDLFVECNQKTLQIFNCKEENILLKSPVSFSPDLQPDGMKSIDKAKEFIKTAYEKGTVTFEWLHKKFSGELFDAEVTLKALEINNEYLLMAVVRDVREKKLAVNFKTLAEESLIGVYLLQDGRFQYANPKILKIFGIQDIQSSANFLFKEFIYPDDMPKVMENIENCLSGKQKQIHYGFRICRPSGEVREVEILGSTTISNNRPALMGSLIDVTDTKQAHEKLRMLAHALKGITQAVSVTDMNNKILFVNDAFLKMYGYTNDDLDGWKIEEVRSDKNPKELGEHIRLSTLSGGWNGRVWNKRKDGVEFLAHLSTSIVKDDGGKPIALMGIATDITEKKKSEEQVNLLTVALQSAGNGVLITNNEGIIIWVNNSFSTLTGYEFAEIIGENVNIFKSGKMEKEFYADLYSKIEAGKVWHGEIINKKKNGNLYTEEMTITPVRIDGKEITHYIALKQDVSERKQNELALKKNKEAAEAANKLKSIFLANMSHELRTPMVGILGYADILNSELKETEFKEMASNLFDSGNRLMETLNLILHLSKLEANKMEMDEQIVSVESIIQQVISQYNKMTEKRKLYLEYNAGEDVFCFLEGKILKEVLSNLLSNAIKFTTTGGIKIVLSRTDASAVIEVIDTGIGIRKDLQRIIFEEFRQASEGINRKFEGAGLGLTISKKFVELMGGSILVKSEEGVGSTFTVELPLYTENKKPEAVGMKENHSTSQKKENVELTKKVLLVENDRASREITRLFLKKICLLDFAEDGETAIKLVKKNIYNAILMDINLDRGMSGLDVTKSIRKISGCEAVPIIALTAYAMEGDQEEFLAAGCSHYLSKPFDRKTISEMLTKILAGK
ncbi:MAG: PAS domain S-box protein [Ignavibacteriaceae bacterium]|nr:PAS domain S-box protein [Ignavibacteriaceae bacterium]